MTFRLESHSTEELYQLLESGHINVAFLRNPQENRNFVMEPFFSEEFRVIVAENSIYPEGKINLEEDVYKRQDFVRSHLGQNFS